MRLKVKYILPITLSFMFLAGCQAENPSAASVDQNASSKARENKTDTSSASEQTRQNEAKTMNEQVQSSDPIEFPADACTQEGYRSFFEAFVRSDAVRKKYTSPELIGKVEPFKIALDDFRWTYSGKDNTGNELLDVSIDHQVDAFKVSFVKAEFNDEDEVVKRLGTPGVYEFKFIDGCWKLTGEQ